MKHELTRPARGRRPRGRPILVALLACAALLIVPAAAGANQVFKPCKKDWVKQTKKLSPEQLSWRLEERSAEVKQDLDGDGLIDTLILTNWPSYRNCDLKKNWHKKEVTIRIEYGHGKTRVIDWIGDQLVDRLKVYAAQGKILVVAVDSQGRASNRWVQYREVEDPSPSTAVAELSKEGTIQLASVRDSAGGS